jgi:hypothetical protein
MAWTLPSAVATGDVLTATNWNNAAVAAGGGFVAFASRTTSQTGVGTSATDLTGLSVTFTATSTRYYRVSVFLPMIIQDTAAGTPILQITDSAGTVINQATVSIPSASYRSPMFVMTFESGLSGSITRKARLLTSSNTCQTSVSSGSPALLIVEDLGST